MTSDGSASTNAITTENSSWWLKLLDRYGMPTLALCVGLWAIWQMTVWAASNVGVPLVDRHVKFVDAVQSQVETQTIILRELSELNKSTTAVLVENQKMLRDALKQ